MTIKRQRLPIILSVFFTLIFALLFVPFNRQARAAHSLFQETTPAPQPTPTYVPGPVSETLSLQHTLSGGPEMYTMDLELQGVERDGCYGIPQKPVDAMLVFDSSSSAGTGPDSNWAVTLSLTEILLNHQARPIYRQSVGEAPQYGKMGLITSQTGTLGPEPFLQQDLTGDFNLLRATLPTLIPTGDTDIAAGIDLAVERLLAQQQPDRAQIIVLMLHDNVAIEEQMISAVQQAESSGISVYIVANSKNLLSEKKLTLEIASRVVSSDHIYLDPALDQVLALFLQASEANKSASAGSIIVWENFLDPTLLNVTAADGPNARIETERITWQISTLPVNEVHPLGYDFRPTSTATSQNLQTETIVAWLDCNGYPQTVNLTDGFETLAITPTTSGETDTGLDGTSTTSDTDIPQTPDGPIIADPIDTIPTPDPGGSFIATYWPVILAFLKDWWWLLPLLLLLLLLLWFLFRLFRKPAPEDIVEPPPLVQELQAIPSENKRKKSPEPGEDIGQDWQSFPLQDKLGITLTLRDHFEPVPARNEELATKPTQVRIRVEQTLSGREEELGSAVMKLERLEVRDPITGQVSSFRLGKIDSLDVASKARRRGIGSLILKHLETIAREKRVSKIQVTFFSIEARSFLLRHGYQLNNNMGEKQL